MNEFLLDKKQDQRSLARKQQDQRSLAGKQQDQRSPAGEKQDQRQPILWKCVKNMLWVQINIENQSLL